MAPLQIAELFYEDGFVVMRGVFSPDEVAEIERQLQELTESSISRLPPGSVHFEGAPTGAIKAIHSLEVASPFFSELGHDDRLMRQMDAIWPGAEIQSRDVMFFGKAARSGSLTPPHQDNGFHHLDPAEDLVCTISIDESTPENGALCVQRGSHKFGRLPHRPSGVIGFSQTLLEPLDPISYPEVRVCMRPGDVCLHHANVIHYSGPNKTARSRRQLGIGYRTSRAKRDEAAWAKYQAELNELYASTTVAT